MTQRNIALLSFFEEIGRAIHCGENPGNARCPDVMNALPQRKLEYRTPKKLFDDFLDEIYGV